MTRTRRTLGIGSISEGTTIAAEIADSLLWDLERIRLSRADRAKVCALRADLTRYQESDPEAMIGSDDEELADWVLDEATTLAESYAPDYCSIGMHPGDGADFGVWPDWDSIQSDGMVYSSEHLPGENREADEEASGFSHWAHVNDHGNTTLLRRAGRRWVACWDCV